MHMVVTEAINMAEANRVMATLSMHLEKHSFSPTICIY